MVNKYIYKKSNSTQNSDYATPITYFTACSTRL